MYGAVFQNALDMTYAAQMQNLPGPEAVKIQFQAQLSTPLFALEMQKAILVAMLFAQLVNLTCISKVSCLYFQISLSVLHILII